MNNITELENELQELKDNLSHQIILSVLIIICSLMGAYLVYNIFNFNNRILLSFFLVFAAYIRNVIAYDSCHKKICFYWERILHLSKGDIRVKRYLDNNYETDAFLYLEKHSQGYTKRDKWHSISF